MAEKKTLKDRKADAITITFPQADDLTFRNAETDYIKRKQREGEIATEREVFEPRSVFRNNPLGFGATLRAPPAQKALQGAAKLVPPPVSDEQPSIWARIGTDIQEAISNGEVLAAPFVGMGNMVIEGHRLFGATTLSTTPVQDPMDPLAGIEPVEETSIGLDEAKKNMNDPLKTGTGKVITAATPYVLTSIPAVTVGLGVAAAYGLGPFMTAVLAMASGAVSDAITGAMFENPDDPTGPAAMIMMLAKSNPDSEALENISKVVAFIAAEDDDPELLKRVKRGAQEGLTALIGEAALGAMVWLVKLRPKFKSGATKKFTEELRKFGSQERALTDHLAHKNPELADQLHGPDAIHVSPDVGLMRGANRFADALDTIEQRIAEGKSVIPVDAAEAATRAARKQRREELIAQGNAAPGQLKNERRVIPPPKDSDLPPLAIGELTPEDWIARTERMLDPNEVAAAAQWYSEVFDTFAKVFGEDEAPIWAAAWLLAQKNVQNGQAMMNVMRAAEAIGGQAEKAKKAGLSEDTLRRLFLDQLGEDQSGVGQKLYDFVDSGLGRDRRTFYGDAEIGGAPAVVDVHTFRDAGGVDEAFKNFIEKNYGKKAAEGLKVDAGTRGLTEPQYERAADWLRGLTEDLNARGWAGRTDWTPAEVQSVGWHSMSKLTGNRAASAEASLIDNLRRVSYELDPGEGSPLALKLGERFNALPVVEQTKLTRQILKRAQGVAERVTGARTQAQVYGSGGWEDFPLSPAVNTQLVSSPEAAELYANIVGYLAQQTEVWVNVPKKTGNGMMVDFIEKGGKSYLGDDLQMRAFWQSVRDADSSGLIVGFQPIKTIDGEPGIRVLVNGRGKKVEGELKGDVKKRLEEMLADQPFDIEMTMEPSQITKAGNDWKVQSDGETYLQRIEKLGGGDAIDTLRDNRSQLEQAFERAVEGAEERRGRFFDPGKEGKRQGRENTVGELREGAVQEGVEEVTLQNIESGISTPKQLRLRNLKTGEALVGPNLMATVDPEGRPLAAKFIAGIREPGGPNIGLKPADTAQIALELTEAIEVVPEFFLQAQGAVKTTGGALRAVRPGSKGLEGNRIKRNSVMALSDATTEGRYIESPQDLIDIVEQIPGASETLNHELGHIVDERAFGADQFHYMNLIADGAVPEKLPPTATVAVFKGMFEEMEKLSRLARPWLWEEGQTLANRFGADRIGFVKNYRSSYKEMMADSIRIYMENPALAKELAPEWTRFLRGIVNDNDRLGNILQFAGIGGLAILPTVAETEAGGS